jgi:hypothetical protein
MEGKKYGERLGKNLEEGCNYEIKGTVIAFT